MANVTLRVLGQPPIDSAALTPLVVLVSGADVSAFPGGISGVTDALGDVTLDLDPSTTYSITVSRLGYNTVTVTVRISAAGIPSNDRIIIRQRSAAPPQSFTIKTFTFTIKNRAGTAVPGVRVRCTTRNIRSERVSNFLLTDANGQASFIFFAGPQQRHIVLVDHPRGKAGFAVVHGSSLTSYNVFLSYITE